jgi:hypothetical protein
LSQWIEKSDIFEPSKRQPLNIITANPVTVLDQNEEAPKQGIVNAKTQNKDEHSNRPSNPRGGGA